MSVQEEEKITSLHASTDMGPHDDNLDGQVGRDDPEKMACLVGTQSGTQAV